MCHAAGKNPKMWPAEGSRQSKRLAFSDDEVGAVFAGRFEQTERNRIDDDDEQRARTMNCFGQPFDCLKLPEEIRVLNDQSGDVLIEQGCQALDVGGRIFVADDRRGIRST